jgi:2-keto-3-deoxy-L-rhamnonate aldolase RhmA
MENAVKFRQRIAHGLPCLGTGVSFSDPTVAELLCQAGMDFLWIDTEHNPLTSEAVQSHIIATRASDAAALVRVGGLDQALFKPVLDSGADGVIVPLVRTAQDVEEAVALCRYPPQGRRGFGPRRVLRYGQLAIPEFCRLANESVLVIVQIELAEAVDNLDAILETPGLDAIVVGPNDLAGSIGHMGEPNHPQVLDLVEDIVRRARAANVLAGLAIGQDPAAATHWIEKGVQWLCLGVDWALLMESSSQVLRATRTRLSQSRTGPQW